MFTGIIENIGHIVGLEKEGSNLHFDVQSKISNHLKVNQSVAHNGVCLSVVNINGDTHRVTAINETIQKSNLGDLQIGSNVNLERSMQIGDRFDGHIVQGHVDQTAICVNVKEEKGSYVLTFEYDSLSNIIVDKGSIAINGVSLTIINANVKTFSVAIIPYTFTNTNFHTITPGTIVNIEFDILGKYIGKMNIKNTYKR